MHCMGKVGIFWNSLLLMFHALFVFSKTYNPLQQSANLSVQGAATVIWKFYELKLCFLSILHDICWQKLCIIFLNPLNDIINANACKFREPLKKFPEHCLTGR